MLENAQDIDYHIYKTYQVISQVGKGTYGLVYKVKHKKTHELFAIKKICDAYQNIIDAKRTYRQLNYLLQLSHPCIVKLFHIMPGNTKTSLNNQSNTSRIQNNYMNTNSHYENMLGYITQKPHQHQISNNKSKHVYAVFEFVQSDLAKALKNCTLQSIQRKYIAYQILQGLSYLHKSKLIHRDIKPSNILIDANCEIKICDFGLCRLKEDTIKERQIEKNIITEYVASRWYRPPEILLGFSPCNQAIDMWSTGCLMAQLITKTPFFQGTSTMDQLQKIFRVIGLPKQQEIQNFETDEAKFLLKTFTFSRKNKPQKLSQLLHEGLDQQIDLIQNLLQFNPNKRFTADEALSHSYFRQIQQMNCNFSSFNHPVKIIDSSLPSTLMGDLKNFNNSYQNRNSNQISKKRQLTLQQYQCLIQELQRATSRSSNRGYQQFSKHNNQQGDRVIQDIQSKRSDEGYNKQKSTRESNFLYQHKLMQVKNKLKDKRQKEKMYQNQFMQYSSLEHIQQYKNSQRSSNKIENDLNQQKKKNEDNQKKVMKTYQNQLLSYQYQKKSSSMEQDLQQHYKDCYNQNNNAHHNKVNSKQIGQNVKKIQKQKVFKQKSKNKSIKGINTKSNSKISVDSKKQKIKRPFQNVSKQKNKESPIENKFMITQGAIINDKKTVTNLINKKSKQKKYTNNISKNKLQKKPAKIEQVRTVQSGFWHKLQNSNANQSEKYKSMQNWSLKNLSLANKISSPPLPQGKTIQTQGKYQPNLSFEIHQKNKSKSKQNYTKSRSKSKESLHINKHNTNYNLMQNHRQVQSSLSTHSFLTQKSTFFNGSAKETNKFNIDKFKKNKNQSLQKKSLSKNKPGIVSKNIQK